MAYNLRNGSLADRIEEALRRSSEPLTSTQLADRLNRPTKRVLAALYILKAREKVENSGRLKHKQWWLT